MKRSEIAAVILIAGISVTIAYFVAQSIFGGATNQSVQVKTITPISSNFQDPDPTIFNSTAINPAVQIQINSTTQ